MTLFAFILILCSAFCHAGWNFLCKSHHPSPAFMFVLNVSTMLFLLPFALCVKMDWAALPAAFWCSGCVSIVANACYSTALGQAYRYGDISVVYPISRALPVLLTALTASMLHLGKTPGLTAVLGLVVLFWGCLLMPQKNIHSLHWKNFITPALVPILFSALGTTCYTITDSIATAHFADHAVSSRLVVCGAYFFWLQFGLCLVQAMMIYGFSSRESRREVTLIFHEPFAYLAGAVNCVAYFLVLVAMGHVSNVSYVMAFRQMGLPIGVFAGIYILKEPFTLTKCLGVFLIVAGLVLTVV